MNDRPIAGSAFSGIGGMDLGLAQAGFRHAFFCEADEYRRGILRKHWPGVPVYEDVVHLRESAERAAADGARTATDGGRREAWSGLPGDLDLLCGGFPCQDLSVAGRRAGLEHGHRSSLFFEFAAIADAVLADGGWVLIENVPGLLSSNDGRDFAVLLATLAELGFHDLAWRVLDSRHFGVPQRRRRVFILARRSRGRSASEVLLEPESGGGNFASRPQAGEGTPASFGEGVAGPLGAGGQGSDRGARTTDLDVHGAYVADTARTLHAEHSQFKGADHITYVAPDAAAVSGPITKRYGKGVNTTADDGAVVGTIRSHPRPGSNSIGAIVQAEAADADGVRAAAGTPGRLDDPVTFIAQAGGTVQDGEDVAPALTRTAEKEQTDRGLRVLADLEAGSSCAVDPRPDGARYAGCGDAVTVNVAAWIGRRLIAHA